MTCVKGRDVSEAADRAAIRDLVDSWAHCHDELTPMLARGVAGLRCGG